MNLCGDNLVYDSVGPGWMKKGTVAHATQWHLESTKVGQAPIVLIGASPIFGAGPYFQSPGGL
jgi:hypothetical protein